MIHIKFFDWFENHINIAYSLIRIFLGFALCIRGLLFMFDPQTLTNLAGEPQNFWIFAYTSVGHLIGGFLLGIGWFVRLGALIQIPILLGAVFTIHLRVGLLTSGQSLELSVLVLFLLVVFFLFGDGGITIKSIFKKSSVTN
ncbi:DoxX family membrane protein [Bacteroidetes/Chlorobi group bacterium MS-B_bin-24]|jgi:uncharacterized membrane protein YphA (DoxX/SURF4 family)|nr:MAG: DoxX family membrane protein [Bacteroidetes/Chlorobi group bacterium MS-B_bin-24]